MPDKAAGRGTGLASERREPAFAGGRSNTSALVESEGPIRGTDGNKIGRTILEEVRKPGPWRQVPPRRSEGREWKESPLEGQSKIWRPVNTKFQEVDTTGPDREVSSV